MSQGHLAEVTLHHEHKAHRSHFHGFVPTEYQPELMPLIEDLAHHLRNSLRHAAVDETAKFRGVLHVARLESFDLEAGSLD